MSVLQGLVETSASLADRLWPAAFWWLVTAVLVAALLDRPQHGDGAARRD